MTALDDRERRFSLVAAVAAGGAFVTLYVPWFDTAAGVILALIGVAMAGLLGLAARARHRLFTVIAAFLLGFGPWNFAWILGLPFMGLAAWLMFRGSKAAAEESARRRAEREEEPPRDRPARVRRRRRAATAPEDRSRPARPVANKRYTPPQRRR